MTSYRAGDRTELSRSELAAAKSRDQEMFYLGVADIALGLGLAALGTADLALGSHVGGALAVTAGLAMKSLGVARVTAAANSNPFTEGETLDSVVNPIGVFAFAHTGLAGASPKAMQNAAKGAVFISDFSGWGKSLTKNAARELLLAKELKLGEKANKAAKAVEVIDDLGTFFEAIGERTTPINRDDGQTKFDSSLDGRENMCRPGDVLIIP